MRSFTSFVTESAERLRNRSPSAGMAMAAARATAAPTRLPVVAIVVFLRQQPSHERGTQHAEQDYHPCPHRHG